VPDASLRFTCPRCDRQVDERFYGPCATCRTDLVGSLGRTVTVGETDVAAARFEPARHVVPNHVATKE
jgi:hypothetical protein